MLSCAPYTKKPFGQKALTKRIRFGLTEEVPGEELEGDHPLVGEVEESHRVDDLLRRHHQVHHSAGTGNL